MSERRRLMASADKLHYDKDTLEILDDWETVGKICARGRHKKCYKLGCWKTVSMPGMYGAIRRDTVFEIIAFDAQTKSDGSGKAPVSWFAKTTNQTRMKWGQSTGFTPNWSASYLHSSYLPSLYSALPDDVKSIIKEVTNPNANGGPTNDNLWVPSNVECQAGGIFYESLGTNAQRARKSYNGVDDYWWLRSASGNFPGCVMADGSLSGYSANMETGVAIGFAT